MPIQYRCPDCDQLLSISTRKAGCEMPCPRCGSITIVPVPDVDAPAAPPEHTRREADLDLPGSPAEALVDIDEPANPPAIPAVKPPDEAIETIRESAQEQDEEPAGQNAEAVVEDLGGFQLRRARPELGELDLTSMVDVTFLLLIFFMVTASFSLQKTIEVPAPKQDQKGAAQSLTLEDLQANTIFVKIDERNGIFVDDVPAGNPDKLVEVLTQARLTTLRTELAIDAHPEALHESVVLVIDAATAAGMQKIRIVSRSGGAD